MPLRFPRGTRREEAFLFYECCLFCATHSPLTGDVEAIHAAEYSSMSMYEEDMIPTPATATDDEAWKTMTSVLFG